MGIERNRFLNCDAKEVVLVARPSPASSYSASTNRALLSSSLHEISRASSTEGDLLVSRDIEELC